MASFRVGELAAQVKALVKKNLLLLVVRHWLSTLLQALILPVAILAVTLNVNNYGSTGPANGIGSPIPIPSLRSVLSDGKALVIVKPPGLGTDVDRVIDTITKPLADIQQQVVHMEDPKAVAGYCQTTFRAVSNCHSIVIFNDSPLSTIVGLNHTWNYTIRTDSSRAGYGTNVFSTTNDEDVYQLPLQLAVDNAITNSSQVPEHYYFSRDLQDVADSNKRVDFAEMVVSTWGIVFFISMLFIIYHVVYFITTERDTGVSQLIDAMGGSATGRVLAYVLTFDILYLPTWIIFGSLYWYILFPKSNFAIPFFWQLLTGTAIVNASIFAAAFFKKSRISAVLVAICFIALAGAAISMCNDVKSQGVYHPDTRQITLTWYNAGATTASASALSFFFPAMNYIFCLSHMARFGFTDIPIDMTTTEAPFPPGMYNLKEYYNVNVGTYWGLLAIQIVAYPLLAILAERYIHGINRKNRTLASPQDEGASHVAAETKNLTKTYHLSLFNRSKKLLALDGLDLVAQKNQILCLLGLNGAGKSTTLDLLSGFQRPTSGSLFIDATPSKLGLCPQKNVMFDRLTVLEHVKFWSQIKGGHESLEELRELIAGCDLSLKMHSKAGQLSGGQKRKLQLACMFVGGSTVCLMDEVTSGLDPLSRRVIWDIILAERSKRSMVFTTHFLDEGEVLADHITILSKGKIKCQGTVTELKNQFGGGYRVHIPRNAKTADLEIPHVIHQDRVVFTTPNSKAASRLISTLEAEGHSDVEIAGPTIEEVFLRVTKDDVDLAPGDEIVKGGADADGLRLQLSSGRTTSFWHQVYVLLRKRVAVLPRYWVGALLTLLLPLACMPALNKVFLVNFNRPNCTGVVSEVYYSSPINLAHESLSGYVGYCSTCALPPPFPIGPASAVDDLARVIKDDPVSGGNNVTFIMNSTTTVSSLDDFQNYIQHYRQNITFGGLWNGDSSTAPVIAQKAGIGAPTAMLFMNIWSQMHSNIPITVQFSYLSSGISGGNGSDGFVYILYAGIILAIYPSFFALYPAFEKSNKLRSLQFSNGVRPLPLWTSYFLFDAFFVLIIAIAFTATIARQFPLPWQWWFPGYMFPVVFFHGLTGILIAYIISTLVESQFGAFLWTVGIFAISYFGFGLAYALPNILTDPTNFQHTMETIQFSMGFFFPIGNVLRAMAIGMNLFRLACRNEHDAVTDPGSFWANGLPIMYLVIQVVLLTIILFWIDGDLSFSLLRSGSRHVATSPKEEFAPGSADGVEKEISRVEASQTDLLRISHVSKSFGSTKAVDDVSLGLASGEILALLGPNGAGKTTIVNMVRGDIVPDSGNIYLRDIDVVRQKRLAQKSMGVCPQFDALDLLTAKQHLEFFARIKGLKDIKSNVELVMARVGLTPHASKQAYKLSGGNKRKLSLAIALIGNPDVLILDEPSSSMDALAKRMMWRILEEIAPGRSLLLTTHSMEEADALATRAAILAGHLLALGTTQELRQKYSNLYHIQLVLRTAPLSSPEEMHAIEEWIKHQFTDVTFEGQSLGGQIKFMLPTSVASSAGRSEKDGDRISANPVEPSARRGGVGNLIEILERHREELGLEDYSIGAPTLERVFLSVVKDQQVVEDFDAHQRRGWWRLGRR